MSLTIVSYVIAGCEVTGKLHHDIEVRGCDHPAVASSFCPQCGKPMHRAERREIPGYDGDQDLIIDGSRWRVVSDGRLRHFAGVVLSRVTWNKPLARVEQIDDATLRELRGALSSINLWDPDMYGIWNVLPVS